VVEPYSLSETDGVEDVSKELIGNECDLGHKIRDCCGRFDMLERLKHEQGQDCQDGEK